MALRADILALLRSMGEGYVSGEEIASRLGISRTAVWKHIQELREAGYDVQSLALIRTMSETAISFRMQKEAFTDVF